MSLAIFCAGCGGPTSAELLSEAQKLAAKGDITKATSLAASIPSQDKHWAEAQFLLAQFELSADNQESAVVLLNSIPLDGSQLSLEAANILAEIQLQNCQISEVAKQLEYVVSLQPGEFETRSRLASILVVSGQRSRADTHLMKMLTQGRISLKDLVMLTQPERRPPETDFLVQCSSGHQSDQFTAYALAATEIAEQRFDTAQVRLEEIVKSNPKFAEAQASLGETYLDNARAAMETWNAQLPAEIRQHPEIWYVQGLWAQRQGRDDIAIRCFWESIRLNPIHRRAMYQLGQLLGTVDKSASAAFSQRAAMLQEYAGIMEKVLIGGGRDQRQFQRMISLLVDMGRLWEAWAWVSQEAGTDSSVNLPPEMQKDLASVKGSSLPRFMPDRDLAKIFDFSHLPTPDLPGKSPTDDQSQRNSSQQSAIHFVDQATELGLDFVYFQSADSNSNAVRIFESTGGGIGVVDLDLDGWSDLLLTQGEEWPLGALQPLPTGKYRDKLFRNVQHKYVDVSQVSGLDNDTGYGQGCSAGDFNNDGFPDLYIGNIGINQLWLNNGDGTFSDVTSVAGISDAAWTTSCLILDLNADGNPDLFDVNYLQGEDVFRVECGKNRCSVLAFDGAPDHVLMSRGDGTFFAVPDATPVVNSKGLGVIAMCLDGEKAPSLFIANDQVPNHFLRPRGDGTYADEATVRGLAVNRDGQPTACMGMASGDVDHDGRIDFFVTNFEAEANCLYMQRGQGYFSDAIQGTGLMAPGIPYVGWGTQFLDADNNGELDLAVTNGHVADFREPGVEYRMPLQFFRNTGNSDFTLESSDETDSVFGRKVFGRALALLDWNYDGRQDFAVSCIGTPVILATNQTENPGHWLKVRLHAAASARDARGTVAEVRIAGTNFVQQLTAGDGYQTSNERILHFGLGDNTVVERLNIDWPSGQTSSFDEVPADRLIDISEQIPALMLWPE